LHFSGDHSLCDHEILPHDYPSLKCKGQIGYLAHLLRMYEKKLDEILTPLGLVHVNMVESLFHTIALFRLKIMTWTCEGAILASTQGALYAQELNLAYWGSTETPSWYFQVELMKEINAFLGCDISFTATELGRIRTQLKKRVREKGEWNNPANRAQRERRRREKKARADAATSDYVNLRTEAGMEAAIAAHILVPDLDENAESEVDDAVTEEDHEKEETERGVDNVVPLLDLRALE